MTEPPVALDVLTPLRFRVRCTNDYWERITTIKHPAIQGRLADVIATLSEPDEVRRSVHDRDVLLFHRRFLPRWVCVVVRWMEDSGCVITAYPADKVKSEELVWTR